MANLYVYGIIPTGDRMVFDVAGLDDHDDEVYTVPYQDVAAVVSASPLTDYRGLKRPAAVRYLMVHQQVIEAVMQAFPILPVKFGTVLPDASWVDRLLRQMADLFRHTLEMFRHRMQMEVVVLWDLEAVFEAIGQEAPIVQFKALVADRPPEASMAERIAIGQMVQASLERRRAALRDRLIPPLREVALDVVVNPPMDDCMVVNLALLVDQAGHDALDERLKMLDEALGGQFTFRCVGPLPPYSFATVEVRVPAFEEIDQARRRLGLSETASLSEIKHAYHRLASRLHPDHNPEDPEADARMAELSQAYQLLTTLAENQRLFGATEPARAPALTSPRPHSDGTPCSFSREAVEQTLLVAIRRQEVPTGEAIRV